MGKKKKAELDAQYETFSAGMTERGFSAGAIKTLWDILLPFSDYAFNKAHSAAYGLVSYWTAYLKANYPAEYMAALLTSVRDDKDKMAIYLAECRRMGIKVLPPDVNESEANFTPVGTDIRFGLSAIRNVGANVVESIVATRASKGRFTDFADFLGKVDARGLQQAADRVADQGRRVRLAGARPRAGLLAVHEQAVDQYVDIKRNEAIGQLTRCSAGSTTTTAASASASSCPTSPSGTSRRCSATSARCSGSTSPTTRCSGSSTSWPAPPTAPSASWSPTRTAATARRSPSAGWSPR